MSLQINISGHVKGEAELAKPIEEQIVRQAEVFIRRIELLVGDKGHVGFGHVNGAHVQARLRGPSLEEEAAAEAPTDETAASPDETADESETTVTVTEETAPDQPAPAETPGEAMPDEADVAGSETEPDEDADEPQTTPHRAATRAARRSASAKRG